MTPNVFETDTWPIGPVGCFNSLTLQGTVVIRLAADHMRDSSRDNFAITLLEYITLKPSSTPCAVPRIICGPA